jgi:aminoglycoside 3-N-acetyltransferase
MEADVIARSSSPATAHSLVGDLAALDLPSGSTVLVHSSLSSIGWTVGGAQTVLGALTTWVGPRGTLVMPTFSAQLTDPATWENPPVPQAWWPTIREAMPPYDPVCTPTSGMGIVPETFRHLPGVKRSSHPTVSFSARGPLRDRLLANQSLDDGLGEASPLARLYDAAGWVLLLGVGHDSNTSMHLAQYRTSEPDAPRLRVSSPMLSGGVRRWTTYQELPKETDDFPTVGMAFETDLEVTRTTTVGAAPARLMPAVDLVDFAAAWMRRRT